MMSEYEDEVMSDESSTCSRYETGIMRLTYANETKGGSINCYGCDNADCSCAYKELPFTSVCYIYAQSMAKNMAVISFKEDHGQWHSAHHNFEANMLKDDDGVYSRVTEFKPQKSPQCSLVGSQWECQNLPD